MRWNTLAILAFWLVVMAGLYLVMDRVRQPRAAVQAADGTLVIPRGSDGHFHVAGSVNGQPVRFLVDTGASLVVVTDALAAIKIDFSCCAICSVQKPAPHAPGRAFPQLRREQNRAALACAKAPYRCGLSTMRSRSNCTSKCCRKFCPSSASSVLLPL